ncbi:hypothetical protein [Streptomyces sp. NPDC058268]|uniref:hypothetical protein n=1 Tax=Streptomyces sp. NPDC058268 TaxID=3346413 RepID=UPI0036EDFA35
MKDARDPWDGTGMAAASATCAAQLPAAGVVAFVLSLGNDDYGASGGSAPGLACIVLFLPLLLPVLGLVHACVQVVPATLIGRAALRKAGRGPEWAWVCGAQLLPGMGWGLLCLALGGPFVEPMLWVAASGVLPALGLGYWERRTAEGPLRLRTIWFRSAVASVGLCVALLGATGMAAATGLIKEYEPPRLGNQQLAGEWRDEGGDTAVLELWADGRAELAKAPDGGEEESGIVAPDDELDERGLSNCRTTGTWTIGVDNIDGRPTVDIELDGCQDAQVWSIGGTEDDPELFVTSGDPDAPEIEKLVKG